MPAAVRLGDVCSGHGCFPSRANSAASQNVFVNGLGWHRVGDSWQPHGCPVCAPHGGMLAAGSSTVFVNGFAAGRVGDPVSCGSVCATGSTNVFADD
ncbi:PAAR domain-containing protein [Hydrogenophilus thermoluteolus]|uniref:PAAR repeat-containing protein n=1 Tax=Hydrogenophilus thermoluteolus TaxID=297 RepID=A0A2Z6DY41_HYDTE|nr:PAAR repeat-containing protein [Hydrogenophilus thermoluteolus]